MTKVYPVLFKSDSGDVIAYIPDFDIYTQGTDFANAIYMARDAIGLNGIDMEDEGKPLPEPSEISSVDLSDFQLINLVDVDFSEYRRKNDLKTVKKNCTLPGWLCYEAEKAHINFSAVLQSGLKKELHISE